MAINLTDSLNAATTKGKLGDAKQVYLNGDTKNLQQAYEEASTHFGTLDNRSTQMEETIKSIAATGGASQASAVTYDNANSQLTATNIQSAVDELQVSKIGNEFKSGIIYDVSAHNDGAVFESLSALLGGANLSTLIPTSVRHGGMSIRFVQSSDNKYVQYRLMSDSFNATPANWQGVDDEPTVNSNNLVKSKGVYNELSLIDSNTKQTTEIIPISINKDNKYVGWSDGVVYDFTSYAISNNIILKKGDTLNYACGANDVVAVLAKVIPNSTHYTPLVQGGPNDSKRAHTYTAPENCEVVITYLKSAGIDCEIVYYSIERSIADLEAAEQNLSDVLSATNGNVATNANNIATIDSTLDSNVHGKVLDRYGNEVTSDGWSCTTDYIPYTQGTQVDWKFSNGTVNLEAKIIFYDSNKQVVEFFVASSAGGINYITASNIPQTSAYIRYSFKTADIGDVYCKVGSDVFRPSGLINEFEFYKDEVAEKLSYKKNIVFFKDAIANTSLDSKYIRQILGAIKSIEIVGFAKKEKLVLSAIQLIASVDYPYAFQGTVSKINDNNSLTDVLFFRARTNDLDGITYCDITLLNLNVISAKVLVDLSELDSQLFNLTLVSSVSDDTFEKYGLSYDCITPANPEVVCLTEISSRRLLCALKSVIIYNLDTTRNYRLRKFAYDMTTGLLTINICTDENFGSVYVLQKTISPTDAHGIMWVSFQRSKALIDFDIVNNSVSTFSFDAPTLSDTQDIVLLSGDRDMNLSAGEEMSLTYDNQPMRLLDCGNLTGKFYLNCGRKIFVCDHIVKEKYLANDPALTLLYEFPSDVTVDQTVYERVEYVNGIKELNTGKVLVNACIQTSYNENFEDLNRGGESALDCYGKYYIWDGTNMNYLFSGYWSGAKYTDVNGWVKRGGFCNMIWDFAEYENYIFVSERGAQGYSGRAWMSNDYGTTWYLIFNAYPDVSWIYTNPPYPFRNPSGFDPDNGDFDRVVPGRGVPFFHIHGIAYDHWRNQVIIVSGDATQVQGSYTAVWVWKNPQNITLWPEQTYEGGYSGTEVYPIGGTKADNPVKMLQNSWTRVGLTANETGLPGNAQFVSCIPFKNYLAFTTDNNIEGGNGIIVNIYPDNIVSNNFRVCYALSPDDEGQTLTHCGGGYIMLDNLCMTVVHRENNSNMVDYNDRRGAILASDDGSDWKRVFVDDTLDSDRLTKIMWGATMIGKKDELFLRYKGYKPSENIIRVMRLY